MVKAGVVSTCMFRSFKRNQAKNACFLRVQCPSQAEAFKNQLPQTQNGLRNLRLLLSAAAADSSAPHKAVLCSAGKMCRRNESYYFTSATVDCNDVFVWLWRLQVHVFKDCCESQAACERRGWDCTSERRQRRDVLLKSFLIGAALRLNKTVLFSCGRDGEAALTRTTAPSSWGTFPDCFSFLSRSYLRRPLMLFPDEGMHEMEPFSSADVCRS